MKCVGSCVGFEVRWTLAICYKMLQAHLHPTNIASGAGIECNMKKSHQRGCLKTEPWPGLTHQESTGTGSSLVCFSRELTLANCLGFSFTKIDSKMAHIQITQALCVLDEPMTGRNKHHKNLDLLQHHAPFPVKILRQDGGKSPLWWGETNGKMTTFTLDLTNVTQILDPEWKLEK